MICIYIIILKHFKEQSFHKRRFCWRWPWQTTDKEYWRKVEKTKSEFDKFIVKVDVKRFDFNNLLQDFKFMKSVVKYRYMFDERAGEKKLCTKIRIHNSIFFHSLFTFLHIVGFNFLIHTHTHTHTYIYIYIIWFGLIWFYGLSTIVR